MEYQQALSLANRIKAILAPHCQKIDIAGSVSRMQPQVKDIDIVCQPSIVYLRDLYGDIVNQYRCDVFQIAAHSIGTRLKGDLYEGNCVTYINYYNTYTVPEGIKIELWMPDPAEYFRHLAIRTGSPDYSHEVIAKAWVKKGWVGSNCGLRRREDCAKGKGGWKLINHDGEKPPVWGSEQEFFNWLEVPYIEPRYREWTPQYLTR